MKVATAFPCAGLSTLLRLGVCMDVVVLFQSHFSLSPDLFLADIVLVFFSIAASLSSFLNDHASIIDL